MAKKKAVYRWLMHSDGDAGIWKLTKNQEDFLCILPIMVFLPKTLSSISYMKRR